MDLEILLLLKKIKVFGASGTIRTANCAAPLLAASYKCPLSSNSSRANQAPKPDSADTMNPSLASNCCFNLQ